MQTREIGGNDARFDAPTFTDPKSFQAARAHSATSPRACICWVRESRRARGGFSRKSAVTRHDSPVAYSHSPRPMPTAPGGRTTSSGSGRARSGAPGVRSRIGDPPRPTRDPVWQMMNDFGIATSRMRGYWLANTPVTTWGDDIVATTYLRPNGALVAIGSWLDREETASLAETCPGLEEQLLSPRWVHLAHGRALALGGLAMIPRDENMLGGTIFFKRRRLRTTGRCRSDSCSSGLRGSRRIPGPEPCRGCSEPPERICRMGACPGL